MSGPTSPRDALDAVQVLVAAFPSRSVSADTVRVYVAALSDLDPELLGRACIALIRERVWPGLPQVGEIRAKYAELADPGALSGEGAYEQLQAWGRSGERSESELDPRVLEAAKTFGHHGAWLLTDPATDTTTRGVQRSQYVRAFDDLEQRAARVEQARSVGALPGVDLTKIGNGGTA